MANEKRLIYANFLKGIILEKINKSDLQIFKDVMQLVCDMLDKSPTVDAVEVVYCKDCARCKKGYCTIRKDSWGATLQVGLHDFCSDAERRADNGNID